MPVTDPISDMLTRIRNAVQVRHDTVDVPVSKMRRGLLALMEEEGFVSSFENVENSESDQGVFRVTLRYYEDKQPVIQGLRRVSRPGLRVYVSKNEIPRYFGGLGVPFLSTPRGVMTGSNARQAGVGGELLFYIW